MIKHYLKLFRVPQWIKNFFVFVPLLFSHNLFDFNYFITVFWGFLAFCLTSSIVYIINDLFDIEHDKLHPVKKLRPLASGKISKSNAILASVFLGVCLLILASNLPIRFDIILGAYLLLNVLYSSILKNIVLLDVFSIAAGFMLRVIGGAFIIGVYISNWLILTTMFISLFLAIMKRKSELQLASNGESSSTRKVLSYYSLEFTNQIATIAASGVIICYALYTVASRTVSVFGTEKLIYTTPFVVFGIFRYMFIVFMNKKGENTSEEILTDIPMILNAFLYILFTVLIVYKII